MDAEEPVVYFNNCHNRDHVTLFGSGAFFDLGTTGRQGTQLRGATRGRTFTTTIPTRGRRARRT